MNTRAMARPFRPSLAVIGTLLAVFALATVALAAPVTLHVSPQGDDAWSGTLPTPNAAGDDGPLASLHAAREAVRNLKQDGMLPGPVRVVIAEGVYELTRPVTFTPEDSGSEDCPVVYAGLPGAVISGTFATHFP